VVATSRSSGTDPSQGRDLTRLGRALVRLRAVRVFTCATGQTPTRASPASPRMRSTGLPSWALAGLFGPSCDLGV
jgi:hypothetical protein